MIRDFHICTATAGLAHDAFRANTTGTHQATMKANRFHLALLLFLSLGSAIGFAGDLGGTESKFFFEFYGDKLIARGRPPNVTYVVRTISTVNTQFAVNTGSFNPMTATANTQVSFSVGDLSHSATLSQDPLWT